MFFCSGSLALSLLAIPQKMALGADPWEPIGFIVPVLFGGTVGLIIGLVFHRLKKELAQRKRQEVALKESEEKYRSMMESLSEPVYICSPDFRVEYMNPAMAARVGYGAVGEPCHQAIHGLDQRCPWCKHEQIQVGEPFSGEVVSPLDSRLYQVSHSPIFHPNGMISKLTIFRDITEQRKAEEEKAILEAQLLQAQKMEAVGTLAGGIAHDFNNILTAVMGYGDLALQSAQNHGDNSDQVAKIIRAAERARDLVNQLLTLGRKKTAKRKTLSLNQEILAAVDLLGRTIPKMVQISTKLAPDLWPISGDSGHMQQVLMNLGVNAADAMPVGGRLHFETRNATLAQTRSSQHWGLPPGNYAVLWVSDTGHGMDDQTLERIFEPFYTTKGVGQGTGLGLAMVYGIVKGHGGHICCRSRPAQGTTFEIYLPAQLGKGPDDLASDLPPKVKSDASTQVSAPDMDD